MERGEVTAGFAGVGIRTVPSRRAFRYFAWPSRSIPMLEVAVGRGADGGKSQAPSHPLTELIRQTGRQLPAGTTQRLLKHPIFQWTCSRRPGSIHSGMLG